MPTVRPKPTTTPFVRVKHPSTTVIAPPKTVAHDDDEKHLRDVREVIGETLDEGNKREQYASTPNAHGPMALLLNEKSTRERDDVADALERVLGALDAGAARAIIDRAIESIASKAGVKDPEDLRITLMSTQAPARLAAVLDDPKFRGADVDEQSVRLAAFRTRVRLPLAAQENLERFLASDVFRAELADVQLAMLRVVRNSDGDAATITGLVRVAQSSSFREMSIASKMSFATIVGATLGVIRDGNEQQRTILRNSLERLLEPNGIAVELVSLRPSTIGVADVENHRILLNRDFRLTDEARVVHLATHTLAHEVNHIVNEPNESAPMSERFMGEYRAWCVGFVAENGRWPTCAEGAERIDHLLDVDDSYANIARAARGGDAEAEKIRSFARLFDGGTGPAPLPDPPGDLVNA